jgi:putative acyl-CoA dehydrogenase
MRTAIEHGLHASPWTDPREGAHVARAAHFYLQTQVEAGHGCPVTMTFAAVPGAAHHTRAGRALGTEDHRARLRPAQRARRQKAGLTIGMAMTEKQGGSDVRANTTRAHPVGAAVAPARPTSWSATSTSSRRRCATPSWCWRRRRRPVVLPAAALAARRQQEPAAGAAPEAQDGQRLQRQPARPSCAARWPGWSGEEGRGVRTIIEMVAMTRFDCMVGSAPGSARRSRWRCTTAASAPPSAACWTSSR